MASADRSIRVYQELAAHYGARGEAQVRDRFLVLAADAATAAGRPEEAERLRHRLLEVNPHHMLRPYSSWSQALQSQDVKSYIDGLRRTYPPSSAENLLESVRGAAEEEQAPQPLPSAALDATVPLAAADMPTPIPTRVPAQSPAARTARLVAPTARTTPIPFAKPAPPANGIRPARTVREALTMTSSPSPAGRWVAVLLFYLVLAAGIALGAYTFIRPFYPLAPTADVKRPAPAAEVTPP